MHPSRFFQVVKICLPALALALLSSGCGLWSGRSGLGLAAAQNSRRYIGVPYQPGGATPQGFDCSGLTYYVYQRLGVDLPRSSASQAEAGRRIRSKRLQPGDLVFFRTGPGRGVTHVGLYLGGGRFIHAPGAGKRVAIAELDSDYFSARYHSARRLSS